MPSMIKCKFTFIGKFKRIRKKNELKLYLLYTSLIIYSSEGTISTWAINVAKHLVVGGSFCQNEAFMLVQITMPKQVIEHLSSYHILKYLFTPN